MAGADDNKQRPGLRWAIASAVAAAALGALVLVGHRGMTARRFAVPQSAMAPAIYGGQHIRVDATAYGLHAPVVGRMTEGAEPQRGDVVVFDWPPDRRFIYVMRVIAVAGDEVRIDQDGWVQLGGRALERCGLGEWPAGADPQHKLDGWAAFVEYGGARSYVVLRAPGDPTRSEGKHCIDQACTVPAGHVFVLGDSRDESYDSRDWGFVPLDHLIGRAVTSERGDVTAELPDRPLTAGPWVPPELDAALERCRTERSVGTATSAH